MIIKTITVHYNITFITATNIELDFTTSLVSNYHICPTHNSLCFVKVVADYSRFARLSVIGRVLSFGYFI